MLAVLTLGERSTKKNTAFRGTSTNPTALEDRKILRLKEKTKDLDIKLHEYKLEMEKILL